MYIDESHSYENLCYYRVKRDLT